MSTKNEQQLDWRRNKTMEYHSMGLSQREISSVLHVSVGTVNKDLSYLRQQAKDNISKYVERLPEQYQVAITTLNTIIRKAWITANDSSTSPRDRNAAMSLIKDCASTRFDLHTNASVIEQAISLIDKSNEQIRCDTPNANLVSKQVTKHQLQPTSCRTLEEQADNIEEEDNLESNIVAANEGAGSSSSKGPSSWSDSTITMANEAPTTRQVSTTKIKTFAVKKEPLDLYSSEIDIQQREIAEENQRAIDDAIKFKPLSDSMLYDSDNSRVARKRMERIISYESDR